MNRGFTVRANGVLEEKSGAFLGCLCQHAERPDLQVRFHWKPNSVAFRENRAVQHQVVWDYHPQCQSGSRLTIKGQRLAASSRGDGPGGRDTVPASP